MNSLSGAAIPSGATSRSAWWWIPTLYFAEGMPYAVVVTLSVVIYKNLGVSNTEISLYTSLLYLPWVIKPLWSPFIDIFRTKRWWIVGMQLVVGASLGLVALALPMQHYLQITLAVFWLMAFNAATHDIAADGFYMLSLSSHDQAAFVGVRSAFYRVALLAGQGGLVSLSERLIRSSGSAAVAWSSIFVGLALLFFALFFYHSWSLPRPTEDRVTAGNSRGAMAEFMSTFVSFFQRRDILIVLAFLLLFRLGEAQALKLVAPFLLDPAGKGGLALDNGELGLAYGTVGLLALTIGGLLGGYVISRHGLKRWLWPMMLSVHLPNLAFVFLAYALPKDFGTIVTAIAFEQFGYGFGFTAFMMYMILVARKDGDNPHQTAHYAICTGFMALGMMLPGMASGWIQEQLGYQHFFIWVCIATLPSLGVAAFLKIDPAFGKKAAHD